MNILCKNLLCFRNRLSQNNERSVIYYNTNDYAPKNVIEHLQHYIIPTIAFLDGKTIYDGEYEEENRPPYIDYIKYSIDKQAKRRERLVLHFETDSMLREFLKLIRNEFSIFGIDEQIGKKVFVHVNL